MWSEIPDKDSRKLGSALNYPNLFAGVAQLVEQLICNQPVGGSGPSTSAKNIRISYGLSWLRNPLLPGVCMFSKFYSSRGRAVGSSVGS